MKKMTKRKKSRSVGGLRIRKLKPYYDEELEEYYAMCPEDCGRAFKEHDIHQCVERAYMFCMESKQDKDLI